MKAMHRQMSSRLFSHGYIRSLPSPLIPSTLRASNTFSSNFATSIAAPEIDFDNTIPLDSTKARIVPVSSAYFSAQPGFTDNLVYVQELLRKYEHLPTLPPSATTRVYWKTLMEYREQVSEEVRVSRYNRILGILQRLHRIHPRVQPPEVLAVIEEHRRIIDPSAIQRRPQVIDEFGRAYANGRRKSSRANVYLVEGEGEVLINGKTIAQHFGRIHDRESALLPLNATNRVDKYNVWATVHGGGTTGQAESLTLAVAKALLIHEPGLKPALRRAGCVTRDSRKVERKKPGHVKARKMPAWVKR